MNIGILALGRGTFDIEFANQKLAECINFLDKSSHKVEGSCNLLLESEETYDEIKILKNIFHLILILQKALGLTI